MFRSASLFTGTSFTVAVFTIFATSNVESIVGIPHEIYSMQRILIHMISRSLCKMCPSAPRVCSEPGGQKPVLSLSLDLIRPCIGFCCWSRPLTYLLRLLLWHCIAFSSVVACNVALCQLVLLGYHLIFWTLVGFSALGAIGSGCSVDTIVSITFMLNVLCLFAKAMSWWSFFQRIVSWRNLEYPA